MAYTLEGRSINGDNVAVGSAMGQERTISGAAPPTFPPDDISVGQVAPEGAENNAVGVANPNPEIP